MEVEVKMGTPVEVENTENATLGTKVEVIQDAPVLAVNTEHKNFTATGEVIPQGSVVYGRVFNIDGLRKGQPFKYRVFITNDKKIIHLNKIKPMKVTEVTLGADSKQSPTVVDMARPKNNFTKFTVGGALIGAGAGWYYAKKMRNLDNKKVTLWVAGLAIAGFFAGRMIESRKAVVIKSK